MSSPTQCGSPLTSFTPKPVGDPSPRHREGQTRPILIQHGRLDPLVPVQQSICLVRELEKRVDRSQLEFNILEDARHPDPLFETDENTDRVFGFLDAHLK